jgi:HK97 gp10 family phage protein
MDRVTLDMVNLADVFKDLDKLDVKIQAEVRDEMNASALTIQSSAKRSAPVDLGFLRNSIYLKENSKKKEIVFTVGAKAKYAPYIEFGTGTEVTVPAGYEELAILFKGKNAAKINIRPQPFLIPAFENEKPKLIERITKLLKNVKS